MSYSYSRLATFEQCPYKHKLIYVDGNFIPAPSLATDFGILIHSLEEIMGNKLKSKLPIDYEEIKNKLNEGVKKIATDYENQFYELDKNNRSCDGKYHFYLNKGLHRLEDRINKTPGLEIIGCEKEFFVDYRGLTFHGFIDRLLKNGDTYIIEDIKTYSAEVSKKDLSAPMQFVIYTLAIQKEFNTNKILCAYDLPLCNVIQQVPENYMTKGLENLDKLIDEMNTGTFEPKPSPLCHWCLFCVTYPNQPEEAKGLCPYYSLWTRNNKTKAVRNAWLGEEGHKIILERYQKEIEDNSSK